MSLLSSPPVHYSSGSNLHSLPGPEDITRIRLPNGIVVLSRANFHSLSVVINGYLPAGGILDPNDKLGMANFTASALMRGTQQHSFQQIYDILESAGASLGIGCSVHTAGFSGKALAEDLDMLLGMVGEVLRQPTFPFEQIERLRAHLLTALEIRAQDTGEMASLAFDQVVYDGHPYSRPEDGYPETVQAIKQADLAAFQRKHYGPRGLVIAIAGAVHPEQAVEKVARALGDWQNPEQPENPTLPPLKPLEEVTSRRVPIPGKSQADMLIGAAGPPRRSPDFQAASLGNSILGQFGMMGRIGDVVREKAGLAYYASSHLGGGLGPGSWDIAAGVDPEHVDQVIDLIIQELRHFTSEPVKVEELNDNQAHFIGRLPLSLESNAGVAAALTSLERYQLGLDYYLQYAQQVQSVTPEDVLEVAQRYLDPERLCIAVAGP